MTIETFMPGGRLSSMPLKQGQSLLYWKKSPAGSSLTGNIQSVK